MIYLIPNFILQRINYFLLFILLLLFNIPILFLWLFLLPMDKIKRNRILFKYHVKIVDFVYSLFFDFEILNKNHYKDVLFKQRYLYCSNHQSGDVLLLALYYTRNKLQETIVLHDIFAKYCPVIGWIWLILDHIIINLKTKNTVNIVTNNLLNHKHLSLLMFPEGKKAYDLKFNTNVKTGAFQISSNTNIPILPIYHNMGVAINDKYMILNYGTKIKCYIGDPIYPEGKSVEEIKNEYVNQMVTIEKKYFTE